MFGPDSKGKEVMRSDLDAAARFQLWNQQTGAFTVHCYQPRTEAELCSDDQGDLCGVTVGVKDIIDVAGMPTRNGSDACSMSANAECDAACVAALRSAGAAIVGKTTTTEFAFTDPTDCRNPHVLTRSPGGSSSGSGAAVAAGMVDIALGTQTAGSLCRPAAYCGAVGFKPSYGMLSTRGVTPLARSFDTVGVIAGSVELAERAFRAMHSGELAPNDRNLNQYNIVSMLMDTTTNVAPGTMAAFRQGVTALEEVSTNAVECAVAPDFSQVVSDHRIVMNREAFEAHGHLLAEQTVGLLKPKFLAGLRAGAGVTASEIADARRRLAKAAEAFWTSMSSVDVILTLPVPDGAPLIGDTTGFQDWLTPWTVFGGPLVCLPWGLDSLGRPRAVMLAAHPGKETTVLATARALEMQAPELPRPVLPAG